MRFRISEYGNKYRAQVKVLFGWKDLYNGTDRHHSNSKLLISEVIEHTLSRPIPYIVIPVEYESIDNAENTIKEHILKKDILKDTWKPVQEYKL